MGCDGRARQMRLGAAMTFLVSLASWGCASTSAPHRYYGIYVDGSTEHTWDASEQAEHSYADSLVPIAAGLTNDVPLSSSDTTRLRAIETSTRHGSGDKRFLALNDSTPSHVLAEIKLVKGEEYIKDTAYRAGWIPLAVINVPDSSYGEMIVYPKLILRGGTSWLYVRHVAGSTWAASLVRIVGTAIHQDSLAIEADLDSLPPAPAARFVWKANDDIVWGTCAGNCCKVAKTL